MNKDRIALIFGVGFVAGILVANSKITVGSKPINGLYVPTKKTSIRKKFNPVV